jgi:hypothetical protein
MFLERNALTVGNQESSHTGNARGIVDSLHGKGENCMKYNKSNRGAGGEKESAIRRKRQRASSNDPIETVPEKSRLPYLARHTGGALEGPIVSFSQFGPAFHLRGNLDLAQNGLFVFTVKVGSEDSVTSNHRR